MTSKRDLDTSELLSRNAINPVPSRSPRNDPTPTEQHGVHQVATVLVVQSAPLTCLCGGFEVRRPGLQQRGQEKASDAFADFVAKDTLVVVTATIDGAKGDGMSLDMHVSANAKFSLE